MAVIHHPYVVFGNGYWAISKTTYPVYKDSDGKKRVKMNLAISSTIKEEYNIKGDTYIGDYPKSKVITLNLAHSHPCILVLCGVKGEKTDLEELHSNLLSTIEIYERNEQSHMAQIAYLMEMIESSGKIGEKELKRIANLVKIMDKKKDKDESSTEGEDESGTP